MRVKSFLFRLFFCFCILIRATAFAGDPQPFTEPFFEQVRKETKAEYVGLDVVIDRIFDSIKSWYLIPEFRLRPRVISLWGLTSAGKTSLVKKIVKKLQLDRDFFYYDMNQYSAQTSGDNSITDVLAARLAVEEKGSEQLGGIKIPKFREVPSPVVFIDEIQAISTLSPSGNPENRPLAQPVFEWLGNDGVLMVRNPAYDRLRAALEYLESYVKVPEDIKGDPAAVKAYLFQVELNLRREFVRTPVYVPLSFRGPLFFVGGNLHDVFPMSEAFDLESVSPDQLVEMTERITATDIKEGLGRKFQPQHVSRITGQIIVFPSLGEDAYRAYTEARIQMVSDLVAKHHIQLTFTDRFKERVYQEGVVPTQGIRPYSVIVSSFLEDPLANIKLAIDSYWDSYSKTSAQVVIDIPDDPTVARENAVFKVANGPLSGKEILYSIPSESARASELLEGDERYLVAVRLAGFAVVMAETQKRVPLLIKANSRSSHRRGFVEMPVHRTKPFHLRSDLVDHIATDLAGYAAERMVFNEASQTSQTELIRANRRAVQMVNVGLGDSDFPSLVHSEVIQRESGESVTETSSLLNSGVTHAMGIIKREKRAFVRLIGILTTQVSLKRDEIAKILKETWSDPEGVVGILNDHGPPLKCRDAVEKLTRDPASFILHEGGFGTDFKGELGFKQP